MSKRKKVRKYRGSKTHGGGSMKKRRGAGSRGGRGRAGSGKRGDANKPSYWKGKEYGAGRKGFTSKSRTKIDTMNVRDLDQHIDQLVSEGHAKKSGSSYTVDLEAAGVDRLLGKGQISVKASVSVKQASDKAVKKVEDAGGSVELTGSRKEKKAKSDTSKPKEDAEEPEDE